MVISKRLFLGRGVFLFLIALSPFLFTEAAIPHDESVDLQKLSLSLHSEVSESPKKDNADRKLLRERERVRKQANPCTVFKLVTMFQNKSATTAYMCDLHEVDRPSNAFGKSRFVIIDGLNGTEQANVISGTTTVYSAEATIKSDTLVLPRDGKSKKFVGTLVIEQKVPPPLKNYTLLTQSISTSDGKSKFENVTYVVSEELLAKSATLSSDVMFSFNVTGDGTTVVSTKDYFVANDSTGASNATVTLTNSSVAEPDFVTPSDSSFGTRKLATPSGILNVLVLRVSTTDKSPTVSLLNLRNKVFGTSGDLINLRTQLMACSNGKVTFGKMDAIEATISMPVNSKTSDVESAVRNKYAAQMSGYNLKLIVMPPGTYGVDQSTGNKFYNWLAYGWVGGDVTVYNDGQATFADNQLHEIGHNFGLGHAWYKNVEYADTSNMMGFGQSLDDGKKCFNSAHHIKLGWHSTFTCTNTLCNVKLVGVDDAKSGNYVNINMHGKYSVGYNRKKGMNLDTSMAPDKVLVHTLENAGQKNELVAELSDWRQYVVHNFQSTGTTLVVFPFSFDSITNSASAYIRKLPRSQYFQLCADNPCRADDSNNFYWEGKFDAGVMPPQVPNDSLSFAYIPPGWTFQFFEHANFGGVTRTFGGYDYGVNLSFGSGFNDWVSSFKIRKFPSSEMVMLCQNNPCGTGGKYYARVGNWASMPVEIGNDQLSFVYIPAGFVFWFFVDGNFSGANMQLTGPLNVYMGGYDNAASSFMIYLA